MATAVADVKNDFVVKYYPNPTADQLQVQAILPSTLPVQLSIFDGLGQRLISQKNKALGSQLSATIPVGQLPAGMYWLEIKSGDDQFRKMEKFVKE
ncbi:MAG: T9SS type A sorting domain-containing protein [Saprospiraceae bacterium]